MNYIELKILERKAVEGLRRTFESLRNDAVLPQTMAVPLGEVKTDIGMYEFELRVTLRT